MRRKTEFVKQIEKKLKPQKTFFVESPCCGDGWFMDYNYMKYGYPSYRIQHNLKSRKLHVVKYSDRGSSVGGLQFKSPRSLFTFLNTHFK